MSPGSRILCAVARDTWNVMHADQACIKLLLLLFVLGLLVRAAECFCWSTLADMMAQKRAPFTLTAVSHCKKLSLRAESAERAS